MKVKGEATQNTTATTAAFEASDVSPRFVLVASGILFGAVGCSLLVVLGILYFIGPTRPDRLPTDQRQMIGPRLEVSPASDRAQLQAQAEGRLHHYSWIDANHQAARIPIERAMALRASRGWPDIDKRGSGP